ncbi:MAG TPA: S-methyl-5-thioribose-1-phosphate isomerase [Oscillospiraceae bacterium]|nr:S-methyl-5-thioribose-1-phosphate isomerase [Oscillospiraceae bacterium]
MKPLGIKNQQLLLLDQRLLPTQVEYLTCENWQSVAQAITAMVVRGAPAIGAAAAYGLAMAATSLQAAAPAQFAAGLQEAAAGLQAARPTAVNLAWAVKRMLNVARASTRLDAKDIAARLWQEADKIATEDVAVNKKIGEYGAALIPAQAHILTHCNAGALATVGYGTALGVIRSAVAQGKMIAVYADETRPYLQGARLTAWEMVQEQIPVTVIADSMAGFLMKQGKVDLIIVGADRIAANGDAANKIGTYTLAVLAKAHKIPFYVAAPASTFDLSLTDGEQIPIEERDERELIFFAGTRIAPEGVLCYNPAFDITPAELITAIITEYGVIERPTAAAIAAVLGEKI